MHRYLEKIIVQIPNEYKNEFYHEIYKENLLRMIVVSILLIIFETCILLIFKNVSCNADWVMLGLILFNTIYLPISLFTYKASSNMNLTLLKITQFAYIIGSFFFGCLLSLLTQYRFPSIYVYIICVFAAATFFYIHPHESFVILFSVCLAFCLILPNYQTDTYALTVLRVNTVIMNLYAWIIGRMIFSMKITNFIDKKTVYNQNIQLYNISIRDSMTSLYNNKQIKIMLNEEIQRAKRIGYPLSIMMLDIDDFKKINDDAGHLMGDKIIVDISKIIMDNCRTTDIVGRFGGEEFLIILPDTDINSSRVLAERIRISIENMKLENGKTITVSGGIIEYDGGSCDELIEAVDKELYKAKYTGKNRIESVNRIKMQEI